MLDELFHLVLDTKPEGKTNGNTVDPVVFRVNRPPLCCSDSEGVFVRGGWLICHRSSFQSLPRTAAHLDADVRRLASCAEPVLLSVELRGPRTKGGCISFFHSFFFGGTLQCFCLSSGFILLDSMSSSLLSPLEHKDGGRRGI